MNATEELISAELAAGVLAEALPERTAPQWASWLRENRNHSKKAIYRIPLVKMGRQVFYSRSELSEFVRFHQQLRIGDVRPTGRVAEVLGAFGVGMGGSSTGYAWPQATVCAAVDEATGAPFVQMSVPGPRPTVYRLDPNQALSLAATLADAAREALDDATHRGRSGA
ncbi:hypothetical protein C8C99_4045 [Acidovorax sp. 107]|uniref:hypothetical protein n=1 Tax=Acidovorax sp. 107 TaxID=2135638 RepID=UPI000D3B7F55|nr:hypothetical protein [Acidovorax sp. 107]PUA99162.1 hypothetical protein C8C99_4045 [Acidovorax sp. 107]